MDFKLYYTVCFGSQFYPRKAYFRSREEADEFKEIKKGDNPKSHRLTKKESIEWYELHCEYTDKYIARKKK